MPRLATVRKSSALPARRRIARLAGLVVTSVAIGISTTLVGTGTAVAAGPAPYAGAPVLAQQNDIDEGGSASLREQLEASSKGFIEAKAALQNSTKRQKQLAELVKTLDADVAERSQKLSDIAGRAYRTGRLGPISALLSSTSPEGFMDRALTLDTVAGNEERELQGLQEAREQQARAKTAIDKEVAEEKKQVEVMAKRKQQAERALAAVGSGGQSAGVSGSNSSSAQPAQRNSDGSFPSESCSLNDPTTTGCITPRTLHALNQAKAAGFKRFVSCFRSGGGGEHPLGKACDFAAQSNGFGGVATGGDRTYGNNLAAYYVNNANRLGVLYVIWFNQIWLPSGGWSAYNGDGTPSGNHTNHVHLSMN